MDELKGRIKSEGAYCVDEMEYYLPESISNLKELFETDRSCLMVVSGYIMKDCLLPLFDYLIEMEEVDFNKKIAKGKCNVIENGKLMEGRMLEFSQVEIRGYEEKRERFGSKMCEESIDTLKTALGE